MDISSLNTDYTDYLTTTASGTSLESGISSDYSSSTDEELMDACKEFESYFLEQVFKGMEKTVVKAEETSGADSTMTDYFQDLMIQEMASESTDQNSLGLAQMLYEQMKRNMESDL